MIFGYTESLISVQSVHLFLFLSLFLLHFLLLDSVIMMYGSRESIRDENKIRTKLFIFIDEWKEIKTCYDWTKGRKITMSFYYLLNEKRFLIPVFHNLSFNKLSKCPCSYLIRLFVWEQNRWFRGAKNFPIKKSQKRLQNILMGELTE